MIDRIVAENGSAVLRLEGRLLSSGVDPEAEASAWLKRRLETKEIDVADKVKTVFVLGAGSGYHIAQILGAFKAQIIVIECQLQLLDAIQEIHGFDSSQVSFVCVAQAKELRSQASVKKGVKQSFSVVSYGPSLAFNPEFYRECRKILLGRDWNNLNWQWRLRGFPSLDSVPKLQTAATDPLSIYDLDTTELVQDSEERERMLFKALRELVK